MKKLLIILLLIVSCENNNCEDKIIEINQRYENYFRQAEGNAEQLRLLQREYNNEMRNACD